MHCDLMWILVTWVYSLGENLPYGTLMTFHEFIKNMRIHVYAHCPSNVSNIKSQDYLVELHQYIQAAYCPA